MAAPSSPLVSKMDTRGVTWCPIWPPGVPRDRIFADNSKGGLEFPLPTGNAVFGCPNDHMHARGGGGGGKNSYITFFGGGAFVHGRPFCRTLQPLQLGLASTTGPGTPAGEPYLTAQTQLCFRGGNPTKV